MNKLITLFLLIFAGFKAFAQTNAEFIENDSVIRPTLITMEAEPIVNIKTVDDIVVKPKYGFCSRQQLIEGLADYKLVLIQLNKLREQYEKEAEYNETDFRRQFQEYLEGQKDFPQAILLKRQRDLQESMEKGVAFRTQADSLLRQAEQDLMGSLRLRVDAAIQEVGQERGYEYVIDTDLMLFPYLNAALSEDITKFVEEKLKK